jgi:molybdate transport system regulatory protein
MSGKSDENWLSLRVRVTCGEEIAMGPGKADLLEAIAREGSISAAGRSLGMSYRRCWLLVDTMNRCWAAPLVEAKVGGGKGGGARVTEMGERVLAAYRAMEAAARAAAMSEAHGDLRARMRIAD